MELHDVGVKKNIANLLVELHLPSEVSLDNKNVLRLDQKKNHYSLLFVDKLIFRIVPKRNEYVLEFQPEYGTFFPEKTTLPGNWVEIRLREPDEIEGLKECITAVRGKFMQEGLTV